MELSFLRVFTVCEATPFINHNVFLCPLVARPLSTDGRSVESSRSRALMRKQWARPP